MAWQTIGTTDVIQTSTVLGYVYLQYDDSTSGSNWNVRLVTGPRSSAYYFDVQFNNIVVDGSSPTTVYHVTQNSVVVWSGSLSGGRTIKGSWSCPWKTGTRPYTISGSLPAKGTAPTGGYATYNSSTWDSITFTTGVDNNGGQTLNNHAAILTGSSNGAVDSFTANDPRWFGRKEYNYDGHYTLSHQFTGNDSNASMAYDGPISIKGLLHYKLGWWIENSYGVDKGVNQTLRYLPPSPLQSITYTQTKNSTDVTVNFTVTGGSSADNYSDTVTTYYRYSTNNGSSYSAWKPIGTGTPWTAQYGLFTCAYNSSVVIQAKQTYHDMDSKVEQVSFTASGTAPSGGTLSVTGATWNTITLAVSGVNYGKPDGISGRKLAIGVRDSAVSPTAKRENQVANTTSATTTVNNNSIYPSSQPLNLRGMLPVYPYIWAWNTIYAAMTYIADSPYYLPPAPGQLSYTDPGGVGSKTYPVEFTGVAANNYANYDQADLTRVVRYQVAGGPWVTVENGTSPAALDSVTSFNVTVPAGAAAVIEAFLMYKGKSSELSTITLANTNNPVSLYGSVNGHSKLIKPFYGSVNGETKKITKLYASVGGVTKKVYEDV